MTEARQRICETLGDGGCYFLSLIHLAEDLCGKRIDAVVAFLDAVKKHYCKNNCFIDSPSGIMEMLIGGTWSWRKETAIYIPKDGEFEVLRFEWPTPGKVWSHFVLGDGTGKVKYDPLGESNTVANGELVSKRILKLITRERDT